MNDDVETDLDEHVEYALEVAAHHEESADVEEQVRAIVLIFVRT